MDFPSFLPQVVPGLYLIATPIGNRGDITIRALHALSNVDVIYCEDTRMSQPLLKTYGITKPLKSYHEYNADQIRPSILTFLKEGGRVGLISDAGMPLISDPGYKLVRACQEEGVMYTCVPGASAVLTGLTLSGMPTDKFLYLGFLSSKQYLKYQDIDCSLIFFESPHRLLGTLEKLEKIFGNRDVSVVREITKKFEEIVKGSFSSVKKVFAERDKILGEFVIVLSPPREEVQEVGENLDDALRKALKSHRMKDACTLVSGLLGIPRKQVYARALELKVDEDAS